MCLHKKKLICLLDVKLKEWLTDLGLMEHCMEVSIDGLRDFSHLDTYSVYSIYRERGKEGHSAVGNEVAGLFVDSASKHRPVDYCIYHISQSTGAEPASVFARLAWSTCTVKAVRLKEYCSIFQLNPSIRCIWRIWTVTTAIPMCFLAQVEREKS